MATRKEYQLVRGFAVRTKEGAALDVTRENVANLGELVPASVLKAHIEAGNLAEVDVDTTAAIPGAPVPTVGTDGFVLPTTGAGTPRSTAAKEK